MRAPRVTRHTSIRYSSSCHTRVNMGASIFFTVAMIHTFRSARSRGNVGTNNRSLRHPQRKKSQRVMSGGFGGHSISGCTIWMWYCLNTTGLRRTLHTVFFDIDSSLAAVPVDFFGLRRKPARTRLTSSLVVNGRPLNLCLHRHPVSVNCLHHARMVLSVDGSFAYFARNARCTVTTDLLV